MVHKHRRSSSSTPPVIEVSDSESDKGASTGRSVPPLGTGTAMSVKPKPKSGPTKNKKWQATLVDFAALNGKLKSGSGSTQRSPSASTHYYSSPSRPRPTLLHRPSSSGRQAHSSPLKGRPRDDRDRDQSDESEEDKPMTDASTDPDAVQFEEERVGRVKRRMSMVVTSDEEDDGSMIRPGSESIDLSTDDEDTRRVTVERDDDEDEDEVVPTKRRLKRKVVTLSLSDDSDQQVEQRRRLVKRAQPTDEEVHSEDEEDPMDGLDDNVVLDSRLRSAPQRNNKKLQMRENLARLKRRKLGQDTPPVEESSESSDASEDEANVVRPRGRRVFKAIPGARPTQPTLQDWFEGAPEQELLGNQASPRSPSRSSKASTNDDGSDSSEQDSWIEDDAGGEDAEAVILPEGYSMRGHQSLAHHFKVVMQMFVHLACLKVRKRHEFRVNEQNDQYFGLALRALRRKMDGLRDSLVTSSVWTAEFKEALNTHPELTIFDLEFAVSGCGACRISSRLSTFRGSLSGDDYDRDTFEALNRREQSVDSEDEALTSFDLGRYCKARVRCYHSFVHWEWQLFEHISSEVEVLRTAHRRKDRARTERPAPDDPDGIMSWLDRRGIVQQEWTRLEQLMESARDLEFRKDEE
ncbi:hypothetical protein CTheo_945 [Ceratobasidium theobromae]|uniref:DUF4211 domain-containing protein n=1 Tax=Ceratobasidium theobromae TaxID=1582974 RepID=A0A5N5QX18_9AGAM|nr:hypothetical protein CTheo_945 [Ceratobasidium theobromae]